MDAVEKVVLAVLAICFGSVVLLLIFAVYTIFKDSNTPTFTLRKDQWSCTSKVDRVTTTNILVGKVMVPQTQIIAECVNYSRVSK